MITLIYTEVKTEEIYEEELYDALIDVWTDNFNDISNINELKDCWQEYENDILEHIYLEHQKIGLIVLLNIWD